MPIHAPRCRQQLVSLLGPLAPGHVEEHAQHDLAGDAQVAALSPGGEPPEAVVVADAKVDLEGRVATDPKIRGSCRVPR